MQNAAVITRIADEPLARSLVAQLLVGDEDAIVPALQLLADSKEKRDPAALLSKVRSPEIAARDRRRALYRAVRLMRRPAECRPVIAALAAGVMAGATSRSDGRRPHTAAPADLGRGRA